MEAEPKEMYTVVGRKDGGATCGHGEVFDMVFDDGGPQEEAQSIAYEDREMADDIVHMLNRAYERGRKAGLEASK